MLAKLVATALLVSSAAFAGEGPKTFKPIQAITYDFGSKKLIGYFVQSASLCQVIAMIGERPNLDGRLTATRVRLSLTPGEQAQFDSEEGESVSLTCGESGATLAVDCLGEVKSADRN